MTIVRRKKVDGVSVKVRALAYISVISFCLLAALYLHNTAAGINDGASQLKNTKSIRTGNDNGKSDSAVETGNSSSSSAAAGSAATGGDIHEKLESLSLPKSLILKTSQGDLRIKLRPDLSLPSVKYIKELLDHTSEPCANCRFYRVSKPGILQGILKKEDIKPNTILGDCPEDMKGMKHDCPAHDPNCGCHGPIMTKGMVGWAAGDGGPDFFINTYEKPAKWWNTDHTVWGEIEDSESMDIIMGIYELPATEHNGLKYLDEPIHIDISSD